MALISAPWLTPEAFEYHFNHFNVGSCIQNVARLSVPSPCALWFVFTPLLSTGFPHRAEVLQMLNFILSPLGGIVNALSQIHGYIPRRARKRL